MGNVVMGNVDFSLDFFVSGTCKWSLLSLFLLFLFEYQKRSRSDLALQTAR